MGSAGQASIIPSAFGTFPIWGRLTAGLLPWEFIPALSPASQEFPRGEAWPSGLCVICPRMDSSVSLIS